MWPINARLIGEIRIVETAWIQNLQPLIYTYTALHCTLCVCLFKRALWSLIFYCYSIIRRAREAQAQICMYTDQMYGETSLWRFPLVDVFIFITESGSQQWSLAWRWVRRPNHVPTTIYLFRVKYEYCCTIWNTEKFRKLVLIKQMLCISNDSSDLKKILFHSMFYIILDNFVLQLCYIYYYLLHFYAHWLYLFFFVILWKDCTWKDYKYIIIYITVSYGNAQDRE